MGRKKKIDMYLTETEFLTINLAEKEVELVAKDKELLKSKEELIELNYKNAILSLRIESIFKDKELKEKIKSQQNKFKAMAAARDIEGKWSYNPETREVVKEG